MFISSVSLLSPFLFCPVSGTRGEVKARRGGYSRSSAWGCSAREGAQAKGGEASTLSTPSPSLILLPSFILLLIYLEKITSTISKTEWFPTPPWHLFFMLLVSLFGLIFLYIVSPFMQVLVSENNKMEKDIVINIIWMFWVKFLSKFMISHLP